MNYRIAINGFGRIGRNYLRGLLDRRLFDDGFEVVGINDLWEPAALAHLLAYDSTFGPLDADVNVNVNGTDIVVDGRRIATFQEREPERLPWARLGVDLVIEATGRLRTRDAAANHLKAGARRVLISAPGKGVDATIVVGVNESTYHPAQQVISAASCTTNCAAPMVKILHDTFGLSRGYLTTVHAYTNDQAVLDTPHKDLRRARSAAVNIIPTSTGAAKAIGLVLPGVAGRLDGVALRVPVEDGSICDLTCELATPASVAEINDAFAAAAAGPLHGVLRYADRPLVSRDIVGDPASCVFDAALTQAGGTLVKVFGWYDNEWGYLNRLIDLTALIARRA
ncbi:type I glyceraldehyde-3-phosphate dehydrogenase [Plantactinospora sp. KLBMP9567]|uniref:type I glyceraldehyde-3-phosphate dehydrogenase n=1 Tax=Plantactinospora sp. KLBMP9567 TaxID=3085900 RepID=UPI002982979D|nr:type I glyceraldehyde-3-phosphate dehydrogenase [Plantactinospora sp. KLBMP9567]MDW5330428.1 type I glyceraldehyde-3-phosphate dehydrogenase [Plantactinospora sp. KLBMP9567]